ncbi:sigma-54-dependent Fis family transcriptional regulator [candidate division WOR-3 bacterium]|nr:sigma-54-dependent Fis family transcriptional regulator [candidate division WOR-3 bacterium]
MSKEINGLKKVFSEFNIAIEKLDESYRVLWEKIDRAGILHGFGLLVGKDKQMGEVYEVIKAVADSKVSVLIQGESGTGKELVARSIHQQSRRRDKPFISINCAALPEGLLESELFGHEKGAFTGATQKRKGKFELANGGTLLLDEISEMGMHLQAKLLRVLQEFKFFRVGGSEEISVDVRIIATTNCDLHQAVEEKLFRGDLFYRLAVVPIWIPSLRERKGDIPLLAAYFLRKYTTYYDKKMENISSEAMELLLSCNWPGNVRELENAIERAVVLNSSSCLSASHLDLQKKSNNGTNTLPHSNEAKDLVGIKLSEVEKMLILETLAKEGGNRTKSASLLGISTRTLREKLRQYRTEREEVLTHK